MPNLTSVHVTAGIPDSGTGTVSTIDAFLGTAGTPSLNALTVQGITSGTPVIATGTVAVASVAGTSNVAITNANPNGNAVPASAAPVVTALGNSATTASITSTATVVTVLTANANRRQACIFNDSATSMYVLLGTGTVAATTYTVQLFSNGYYEVPGFSGAITGIWAAANGAARVTEIF